MTGQEQGSRSTFRRVLAVVLLVLAVAFLVATIVLGFLVPSDEAGGDVWGPTTAVGALATELPLLAFALVGSLLAFRRPENPIGWISLTSGVCWMVTFFNDQYVEYGDQVLNRVPPLADWFSLAGWALPAGLLGMFLLLYFPDGRLPSPRWRWVAWLSALTIVVMAFGTVLDPGEGEEVPVPSLIEPLRPIAEATAPLVVLFPICILLGAASLFVRYRRAGIDEREKLKWIAFAGGIVAGVYLVTIALSLNSEWGTANVSPILSFLQTLSLMSFGLIPVAMAFAVLRYRLYDIDRIITRTLSYAIVTVVLLGVYLVPVLVSASVLGGAERPDWIVAVGTLVAAFLFAPLRRRVQGAIDRRFNRRRYDAMRIVEEFTTRLRSRVDLDDVRASLGQVVHATLAPTHVSVWVPPKRDGRG